MITDIHIHLLPGVDDGSQSFEETLAMARCAEADGVKRLVCTPHINADIDDLSRLDYFESLCRDVQKHLDDEGIGLELSCGAEWMLSADLIDVVRERGRLAGSKAFLFELSPFMTATAASWIVEEAVDLGLKPILAHPERYPWMEAKNVIQLREITSMGCMLQLTAGSMTGVFGRGVRKTGEAIARAYPDSIVLASDAHNMGSRRPGLSEGLRVLDIIQSGLAEKSLLRITKLLNTD